MLRWLVKTLFAATFVAVFLGFLAQTYEVRLKAQGSTATTSSKFAVDQAGPDLASVNAYTFKVYADGSASGQALPMTCSGPSSPFTCVATIPAYTPGSHTVTFSATNVAGEGAKSAPLTFQLVIVPSAPSNPRVQ